ncbi:hypothetical protein H5410_021413, partial [Solanum commersonii]
DIAEMLHLNALISMKFAFDNLKDSDYQMREKFIREVNKDWREEDNTTNVLPMSQHIPELELPILMLGDIVISVEPTTRQVEEKGCSPLDEIRILL